MKSFITISIITFSLILNSCSKSFLDVDQNTLTSTVLKQEYVKDLNSMQEFVNGIYAIISRDFYLGTNQIYPDLIADNVKPVNVYTYTPGMLPHYFWQQNQTDNNNSLWTIGYQLIRSCNFVLEKIDDLKAENPIRASYLKGEALGIRAFIHFILVNTFAQSYNFTSNGNHPGIPYIKSSDWKTSYIRNSVGEVYSLMENDLKTSMGLLSTAAFNRLTINYYAAKALLARIYLFKEDWRQSKSLALEVVASIPLMTNTQAKKMYPDSLFRKGESEALFQLSPSSKRLLSGGYTTSFQGIYFVNAGNAFLATKEIADILTQNPDDVRKVWVKSGGVGKDSIKKYPTNVIPGFGTSATDLARSYYQTLFRSSEMYLTISEAAAKSGDETMARTYLDTIRQRANPMSKTTIVSGAALLDSIYLERRKELAFEGLRMFDLLRWKKPVSRLDVSNGAPTSLPYPSTNAISPIPYIDSKNGIPQNPGY